MSQTETTEFTDFSLPHVTADGMGMLKLSEVANKGNVVLAFFPGAYAPVCVTEMERLKADYQKYRDSNTEIVGVSGDLPWALGQFKQDHNIPFPMVSDNTFKVAQQYGVHIEDLMSTGMDIANRGIFVIRNGKITHKWTGEDPTKLPDFDEILESVK